MGIRPSRALRVLLIAAFLLQAVVVQTHVHFARLAGTAQLSGAHRTSGQSGTTPRQIGNTDYCPLCWEAAMAGHYFVPPRAAVPPVPVVFLWIAIPVAIAFDLARPPRGWLSRAPPR